MSVKRSLDEIFSNQEEVIKRLLSKFRDIAIEKEDKETLGNIGKLTRKLRLATKSGLIYGKITIDASGWFFFKFNKEIRTKDEEFFINFDLTKYYSDYAEHGKTIDDFMLAKQLVESLKSTFLLLSEEEKAKIWQDVFRLFKNIVDYSNIKKLTIEDFPKYYEL